MVVCRRWLTGDPQPWPGFTPRHGALVIDIVDKSGYYSGTGTSGTIFDGLTRTIELQAHFPNITPREIKMLLRLALRVSLHRDEQPTIETFRQCAIFRGLQFVTED
jgi:hypothetical protein